MERYLPIREDEYDGLLELMRAEIPAYLDTSLRILGLTWEQFGRLFRTRGRVERIECEGREAGFYWIELRDRVLHIHALILHPEFRGRGIATRLLRRFDHDYAARADAFELGVHESNARARKLYERAGFRAFAERRDLGFAVLRRAIPLIDEAEPGAAGGDGPARPAGKEHSGERDRTHS